MRRIHNTKSRLSGAIICYVISIFFLFGITYISAQVVNEKGLQLLPSGPDNSVAFGAYSTRLKYMPEWEKQWPVSDFTDIVVRFGDKEPRFVFWRGTSYIPCWGTYDGAWFTNEFFERRGGAESGTVSMVEPMSDKQCRYSNVRIIENNEARVIIHWRYAPTDLEYGMAYLDEETHWGDWADEYYILYPDAVGIRKATLFTSALDEWIEYQESIVINQPGTYPEDNLNYDAVTIMNLKGNSKTYSWTEDGGPEFSDQPEQACIQKINMKSDFNPITIVNPENVEIDSYKGHAKGSHFNFWDHWPVSQSKSHTRVAKSSERPSHTSLSQLKWNPYQEDNDSRTWIMMHGMANKSDSDLVMLANSWIHPAELKPLNDSYKSEGYDPAQRAYVILAHNGSHVEFELSGKNESPIVNPAFLIKGWNASEVNLKIDGKTIKRGENFKVGQISNLEGSDLIVWIRLESVKPIKILFTPAE